MIRQRKTYCMLGSLRGQSGNRVQSEELHRTVHLILRWQQSQKAISSVTDQQDQGNP